MKQEKALQITNGKTMGALITDYCKETNTHEGDINFIIGMLVGKSNDRELVENAITNYFFIGAYMGKKYPKLFEVVERKEEVKDRSYLG